MYFRVQQSIVCCFTNTITPSPWSAIDLWNSEPFLQISAWYSLSLLRRKKPSFVWPPQFYIKDNYSNSNLLLLGLYITLLSAWKNQSLPFECFFTAIQFYGVHQCTTFASNFVLFYFLQSSKSDIWCQQHKTMFSTKILVSQRPTLA